MPTLEQELRAAISWAEEAAELALRIRAEGHFDVHHKADDQGPVTRADLAVNTLLLERIGASFPADAILTEEAAAEPGWAAAARCWHIDPIDGTRAFIDGTPGWGVHIGLAIDGTARLGVVAEPSAERLFYGVVGDSASAVVGGVTRPLALTPPDLATLRLVSSHHHRSPSTDAIAAELGISEARRERLAGVGAKIGRVVLGEADLYLHADGGPKLWDTCAPEAILRAAGGSMTTLSGEPLRYDRSEVRHLDGLLATAGVHDDIVAKIRAAELWPPR